MQLRGIILLTYGMKKDGINIETVKVEGSDN